MGQSKPTIISTAYSAVSQEEAHAARARAWSFVFDCFERHKKKKAALESRPDTGKEINERSGQISIPQ